ncbi:MAG: hypothetical protein AAF802_10920 [Planctomycetota bacterium]
MATASGSHFHAAARCGNFASASRLDDFASARRLSSASAVASTLAAEKLTKQTEGLRTARAVAARCWSHFASASGYHCDFATASRLNDFATASWLACGSASFVAASASLAEELREQSATRSTSAVASRDDFATTGGCHCDFAATSGLDDFAAASRLDGTTRIATALTELVKQTERTRVRCSACDHSNGQQGRNDYTTHRDSPWIQFWKVLASTQNDAAVVTRAGEHLLDLSRCWINSPTRPIQVIE